MMVDFDRHGHIIISPKKFLDFATKDSARLASDVLCNGTPTLCRSYNAYRTFVHDAAKSLKLSSLSIWVRGSAHVGFSIAPRAGKVWAGVNDGSDVDLAVVDSDHYHRLDVEIRRWARDNPPNEYLRLKNLGRNRQHYCYRHDDLPSTPTCDEYKDAVANLTATYKRDVTAFFYRDYWSLHDRCMKDIRDLQTRYRFGLPHPEETTRAPIWLQDSDLGPDVCKGITDLNLARKKADNSLEISDIGLKAIGGIDPVRRLWLDACNITDLGITTLGNAGQLEFLSVADTKITDVTLRHIAGQFPNLQVLSLEGIAVSKEATENYIAASQLIALSVRDCKWSDGERPQFKNAADRSVQVTW